MDKLRGRVTVKRKKGTDVTAENIKGQVNQAPVSLSGKIQGVGTPNLVVDVKAGAKHLNLAHLAELSPSLKKLSLAGTVDMDLDIYIPYATAMKTRLNGMLATRNLKFQLAHLAVKEGDSEFTLAGNSALIKKAQVRINETLLTVTGQIANPAEPKARLVVTSPDLDLDRLIPPAGTEKSGDKASQEEGGRAPERTMKSEWPPVAFKTTAHVQVDADTGRYKGMEFQKLKLDATYDRGVIKPGDLSLEMEGGRVAMTGSGDIRDPEHVTFTVTPDITSLPVGRIASSLGIPDVSVSGPMSLNGKLEGRTAERSKDFLAGLQGTLDTQVGPGNLSKIGRSGEWFARIFSLTSVIGILTGNVFEDFVTKGLPYRRITAQVDLKNGNIEVTNFRLESDATNIDAKGRINLLEGQMDVGVRLRPLGAVSTVAGAVPVVGKVAASLIEVYLNLSGSWDDPRASIIPGRGVAHAIEGQAKGVTDFFEREESRWIKK